MKRRKLSAILATTFIWVAFLSIMISLAVTLGGMTQEKYVEIKDILSKSVKDVTDTFSDIMLGNIEKNITYLEENILSRLSSIRRSDPEDVAEFLSYLKNREEYEELYIVDVDGIVVYSDDVEDIGFDFHSDKQYMPFLGLLEDEKICIHEAKSEKTGRMTQYAGASFPDRSGFVFAGFDQDVLMKDSLPELMMSMKNRRIGNEGFLLLCDMDYNILLSSIPDENGMNPDEFAKDMEESLKKEAPIMTILNGKWQMVYVCEEYGYYIAGFYPFSEAFADLIDTIYGVILIEVLIFALVFLIVYLILRGKIVKEIEVINKSLFRITEGDLEERIDVQGSHELNLLSENINATVAKLREMVERESAAMERELKLSYDLRQASIPDSYPAFPEHKEFGIYALIRSSGEQSRDFYDYYLTDEGKLAFVMADIRGEGISGIIFMMVLKFVMKTLLENKVHVDEAMSKANELLYDSPNFAEQFLTASVWAGVLDIDTGALEFSDAGGLRPVLIHNEEARLIKQKPGGVLCLKQDVKYERQQMKLAEGDLLLLYSDGVTETVNNKKEYYGDERLITLTGSMKGSRYDSTDPNKDCKNVCESVSSDVASFAGKQKLPDDVVLMAIKYTGADT